MRNKLTVRADIIRPLFTAGFALAMTFTFGCSSSDNPADDSNKPDGGGIVYGSSVDYGGETYETVVIGNQTWMARNLNYNATGSKCYGEGGEERVDFDVNGYPIYRTLSNAEIQANCDKYGRLYNWATAMDIDAKYNNELYGENDAKHKGICPFGWHIPTNAEWDALYRYADGTNGTSSPYRSATAGRYLKAANGWNGFDPCDKDDTECEAVKLGNGEDKYGFSALPGGLATGGSDDVFIDIGFVGGWWSTSESNVKPFDAYYRLIYNSDGDYVSNGKSRLFSIRCVKN